MEFPECSICLDIFGNSLSHIRTPKVLKCGDTICKECLEDLIRRNENNKTFKCPNCNSDIKKEENIDDYPPNKEIIKLIDSYFKLPKQQEEDGINKVIKYKIILLGNSGVGKTSIFKRLLTDKFKGNYSPNIGIELEEYNVKYKNNKYKIRLYDTCGAERHRALTKMYLKNTDGVIFVFDITDKDSFEDLTMWYNLLKEEQEKIIGILIGNKTDINSEERQINIIDSKSFANEHNLKYFECSAKEDKYIKKAFVSLLNEIIESKALYNSLSSIGSIDSVETNNQENHQENNQKKFILNQKELKEKNIIRKFYQYYNNCSC